MGVKSEAINLRCFRQAPTDAGLLHATCALFCTGLFMSANAQSVKLSEPSQAISAYAAGSLRGVMNALEQRYADERRTASPAALVSRHA